MKNRINKQKIMSILFSLICCFAIMNPVYATGTILGTSTLEPTLGGIEGSEEIHNMTEEILGYVQFGCWSVAIGMMVYVGIKYMMSPANERADLKNSSIRYIIGAVMLGGGSSVFAVIWSIASSLSTAT